MTATHVKQWQAALGVTADGDFGPATLNASMVLLQAPGTPPPPAAEPTPGEQRTSNRGVVFLAANEGMVPGPYLDSVKVWTAGIGHTAAAGAPDPATLPRGMPADLKETAIAILQLFARDLLPYESAVRKAFKVPLKQAEFDAAVSFHYNTGGIAKASWVQTMNAGDKATASQQIMNWSSPPEIIPRRTKEQVLFRDGKYSQDAATVWTVDTSGHVIWKAVSSVPFQQGVDALTMMGRTPT